MAKKSSTIKRVKKRSNCISSAAVFERVCYWGVMQETSNAKSSSFSSAGRTSVWPLFNNVCKSYNYFVNVVDIGAKHGEITKRCSWITKKIHSNNRTRKNEGLKQITYEPKDISFNNILTFLRHLLLRRGSQLDCSHLNVLVGFCYIHVKNDARACSNHDNERI